MRDGRNLAPFEMRFEESFYDLSLIIFFGAKLPPLWSHFGLSIGLDHLQLDTYNDLHLYLE